MGQGVAGTRPFLQSFPYPPRVRCGVGAGNGEGAAVRDSCERTQDGSGGTLPDSGARGARAATEQELRFVACDNQAPPRVLLFAKHFCARVGTGARRNTVAGLSSTGLQASAARSLDTEWWLTSGRSQKVRAQAKDAQAQMQSPIHARNNRWGYFSKNKKNRQVVKIFSKKME